MGADNELQELFTALSRLLLSHGISLSESAYLFRRSFVHAAANRSKLKNGRVNYSRIAAQTGLSRTAARRLLNSNISDAESAGWSPLDRVLTGWRSDRQFQANGKPRRLKINGKYRSFSHLVTRYGGDIPPRAILDELHRIGAVSDDGVIVRLHTTQRCNATSDLEKRLRASTRVLSRC